LYFCDHNSHRRVVIRVIVADRLFVITDRTPFVLQGGKSASLDKSKQTNEGYETIPGIRALRATRTAIHLQPLNDHRQHDGGDIDEQPRNQISYSRMASTMSTGRQVDDSGNEEEEEEAAAEEERMRKIREEEAEEERRDQRAEAVLSRYVRSRDGLFKNPN